MSNETDTVDVSKGNVLMNSTSAQILALDADASVKPEAKVPHVSEVRPNCAGRNEEKHIKYVNDCASPS